MPEDKPEPARPVEPNPDAVNVIRKGTSPDDGKVPPQPNPKAVNLIREGQEER